MTQSEVRLISSALDELEIAIRSLKAEKEALKAENQCLLEIVKMFVNNGNKG